MKRGLIITLGAAGVLGLGLLWWRALGARAPESGRAAARAVVDRLEGHVEERAAVVRELADRFSTWESLPGAGLGDALRSASMRHSGLGLLLVADPAGRLLAGWDPRRRLGDERLGVGSLDPVLGRREALRRGDAVLIVASSHAGVLQSLELAAPIRRADGSKPGYVGATISPEPLRRLLAEHHREGLSLRVVTLGGDLVYPCTGASGGDGVPLRSARFQAWVEPTASRGAGVVVITLLASILLLAALLLGSRALARLDRPH